MSGAPERIRLAIVDDHPVARYGMELVFGQAPGLDVTCAVGSVAELGEAGPQADVTVLDLYTDRSRLPVPQIAALARRCPVLVVSASARPADVLAAIRAGAGGYVTKSSAGAIFVEAVRSVAAGGFYVSSQLADVIHARLDGEGPPDSATALAPREKEALSLIAQGFTQAQAASRMGISPATIDTYIKRIRRKLGPGNKADLTRRAMEFGEIGPDTPLPMAEP